MCFLVVGLLQNSPRTHGTSKPVFILWCVSFSMSPWRLHPNHPADSAVCFVCFPHTDTKRRTIYEYHRVEIDTTKIINHSAFLFTPLPSEWELHSPSEAKPHCMQHCLTKSWLNTQCLNKSGLLNVVRQSNLWKSRRGQHCNSVCTPGRFSRIDREAKWRLALMTMLPRQDVTLVTN